MLALLGVAGHLFTTPRWGNRVQRILQRTKQVNLPACSLHCLFNAERQAGKL